MAAPALEVTSAPDQPIEVASLTDVDGRHWHRLPEAWAAEASLCQQTQRYQAGTSRYEVRCTELAAWVSGSLGLCSRHFAARVVLA